MLTLEEGKELLLLMVAVVAWATSQIQRALRPDLGIVNIAVLVVAVVLVDTPPPLQLLMMSRRTSAAAN